MGSSRGPGCVGRWLGLVGAAAAIATLLLSGCAGPGGRLVRYPSNESSGLNSIHGDWEPHHGGRYIALVTERRGIQEIVLFDTRSQRSIPLPGLNRADSLVGQPSASADGEFIAFAAVRAGRSDIYLYQRSAQQSRNLTARLNSAVRHPSLSERGDRVAFEVSVNGQWDLSIVDRAGRPLNIPTNPR
ncbi:MAG: Tol biopolymer transporter periplasmic protein [Synechococcales cyanobacterium RM1_1_8]|nr:Tol biopolymer transporter periplasmic protein [Synechococcales cyanobacterium RM1_1_8]